MSWFKRTKEEEEKLPDELKGKSSEEVAASLKKAKESEERLAALEEERKTERATVTTMQTQFNDIKTRLEAAEKRPAPVVQQEDPANFIEDPDKAFNQRAAPLANLTVQNAMMTARMLAQQQLDNADMGSSDADKKMDGRLFRAWEGEINQQAKAYQPGQLITPDAWIGIFYFIKGKHADELRNPEARKKNYAFLEPSSHGAPPPEGKKKDGAESLTDQEKHVADRMGVSHKAYAERKAKMQFVNA